MASHMGREHGLRKEKFSITSVKLFGIENVSVVPQKNFKIGTLGDFEKILLTFPHEKTTFQWSKVVSEAIFPTN